MLELGVPLDEFFGAAPGEAYGKAAVFVFTLDTHDGADAKTRVANFAAEHRVSVGSTLRG